MSWDDSGSAFLHGTGPTTTVIDPDGTPNNILEESIGGSVKVDWAFSGSGRFFLTPTLFTVNLYAESIGPGPEKLVGSVTVPGSAHTAGPTWNFSATIGIPPAPAPNSLPANGPGVSGVYRLTVVINNSIGGVKDSLAGFVEGPVIEMRSP
jgi:hypothetical protein